MMTDYTDLINELTCYAENDQDFIEPQDSINIKAAEAIKALVAERDELLAALKKIATKCNLDMYGDDGSLGGYAYGIWNTANTAIASVKEK